jgi:endonuclease III
MGKRVAKSSTGRAPRRPSSESGPQPSPNPVHKPAKSAESTDARRKRAARIVAELKKTYPDATCALRHGSALQLLIATILSAQSTDETVNQVTPMLFSKYPTAADLAAADPSDVEKLIYRTGFFRQKTKSIIGACQSIASDFGGQVPGSMESLIQLRGVARKTANVLLGTWFGKNEGVVVDTHVGRLAHRLGLTWRSKNEKDAVKIEQDLMEVLPREEWTFTSHALIWHGRRVCAARKPRCGDCTLNRLCPSAFAFDNGSGPAKAHKRGVGHGD